VNLLEQIRKQTRHSDAEDGGNMYLRNISTDHGHTMQRRMSSLAMDTEPQNRFQLSAWRRDNPTPFTGFFIPSRQDVTQYNERRRFLSNPFQFIIHCLPIIPRFMPYATGDGKLAQRHEDVLASGGVTPLAKWSASRSGRYTPVPFG
jgi:hypothetical protein